MVEEIKEIPNTFGLYYASTKGDIIRNGIRLKAINNGKDYLCVVLSLKGKTYRFYIHRLVCLTYLENPLNKKEVNHIDGNKKNNSLINLQWSTRSENQKHRYEVLGHTGANLGKVGRLNGSSKPVYQYDLSNKLIKVHESVLEASKSTGVNESNIRSQIYGKQKHAGGFVWKYDKPVVNI